MAVSLVSTGITFPDGTTQTTAAGAVTTTAVLNATAGASVGAVGTYALLFNVSNDTTYPGNTRSGSTLAYAAAGGNFNGSPSGTWRCMGFAMDTDATGTSRTTVYLRIS